MEWPTREGGNVASVLACNYRPPWFNSIEQSVTLNNDKIQ
jgi:hypothetical protein